MPGDCNQVINLTFVIKKKNGGDTAQSTSTSLSVIFHAVFL